MDKKIKEVCEKIGVQIRRQEKLLLEISVGTHTIEIIGDYTIEKSDSNRILINTEHTLYQIFKPYYDAETTIHILELP